VSYVPRGHTTCAALITVALGLAARALLAGLLAKVLGVMLWATLIYVLTVFVAPHVSVARATVVALCISFVVETAQLTPGPAWLSEKHVLFQLVFGTIFSVWDLPMYAGGVLLGAFIHRAARA